MYACGGKSAETVAVLLEKGADPNTVDEVSLESEQSALYEFSSLLKRVLNAIHMVAVIFTWLNKCCAM